MAQQYKLDLINDETGATVSISGEFTDGEVRTLNAYLECVDELWRTPFALKGDLGESHLNFDIRNKQVREKVLLPDWQDVKGFLHTFRPLILEDESTSFKNVARILGQHFEHEFFRNALKLQHKMYQGKNFESLVQIRANGVLLNSHKTLFNWLNAHEYHRDDEKADALEELHQLFSLEVSKTIFLRLLWDKAIACLNIASLIKVALGKESEITMLSFTKEQ